MSSQFIIPVLKAFKHKSVKLELLEKHYSGENVDMSDLDSDTRDLYNQLEQLQEEKAIRQDEIHKYIKKMIRYQTKHLSQTNSDLQKIFTNDINRDSFSGQMVTARNIFRNLSNSEEGIRNQQDDENNDKPQNEHHDDASKPGTSFFQSHQDNVVQQVFSDVNNDSNTNQNYDNITQNALTDLEEKPNSTKSNNKQQQQSNKKEQGDDQQENNNNQEQCPNGNYEIINNNIVNDSNQNVQEKQIKTIEQETQKQQDIANNEESKPGDSDMCDVISNYTVIALATENNIAKDEDHLPTLTIVVTKSNCDDISETKQTLNESTNEQKLKKVCETYSEMDDFNLNNNDIKSRGQNDASYSFNTYRKFKKFSSMTEIVIKNKQDSDITNNQFQSDVQKLAKSQTETQIIPSQKEKEEEKKIIDVNIKQQLGDDVENAQSQATSEAINTQSPRFIDNEQNFNKLQQNNVTEKKTYNTIAQNLTTQLDEQKQDTQATETIFNENKCQEEKKMALVTEYQRDKSQNTQNTNQSQDQRQETRIDAFAQTDSITAQLLRYLTPEDLGAVDAVLLNTLEPTSQKQYFETIITELRLSGRLQAGINIQLRKQVQRLESKVQGLETMLQQEKTASMQRLKTIESNYQALKAQNDVLTAGVSYRENRIEALRCENAKLREEYVEQRDAVVQAQNAHQVDVKRLQAVLDAQKQTSASELQDLEKRLRNSAMALSEESQALSDVRQETQKKILEQSTEIQRLQLVEKESNIKINQQKTYLATLQRNFALFKRDAKQEREKQVAELTQKLALAEQRAGRTQYTETEEKLLGEIASLKQKIEDRDRELKEWELKWERQKSAYDAMRADRDTREVYARRLERELRELYAGSTGHSQDRSGPENGSYASEGGTGDHDGANGQSSSTDPLGTIQALRAVCTELRREKADLQANADVLCRRLEAADEQIKSLQADIVSKEESLKKTVEFFQEKLNSDHFMIKYHSLKLRLQDLEGELNNSQQKQKHMMTQMLKLQTEKDRAIFASNMRVQEQNKKRILLQTSTKPGVRAGNGSQ